MKNNEKMEELLKIWKQEIQKFSKQNSLKVGKDKSKNLSYKRIAYFTTECFFYASHILNKKYKRTTSISKNIEFIESQVYTFAKNNSLSCEQLPTEKPLKTRQPNRKLIPWSVIGFTEVEMDGFIEKFLTDVFELEKE